MIKIGNEEKRTLEEQVLANQADIQAIKEGEIQLANFGIAIVGQVATEGNLPNPTTYQGKYGDCYLVGSTSPYDYYVFTRPNQTHATAFWFDLGEFPLKGNSTRWYVDESLPTGNYNNGDMLLLTNGNIYIWQANEWLYVTNIVGPQGEMGLTGERGEAGQSIKGDPGEPGLPGPGFQILGVLSSSSQLPNPQTIADTYGRNSCYIVTVNNEYHAFVLRGTTTVTWFDLGKITVGPQGPQGISSYSAGTGIDITEDEISVDTAEIATVDYVDTSLVPYAKNTDLQQGLATRQALLSTEQINACNSGINTSKVSTYDGYASAIAEKSVVSGTTDGTNWRAININGTTKNIPTGGGVSLYRHTICFTVGTKICYWKFTSTQPSTTRDFDAIWEIYQETALKDSFWLWVPNTEHGYFPNTSGTMYNVCESMSGDSEEGSYTWNHLLGYNYVYSASDNTPTMKHTAQIKTYNIISHSLEEL